ncbi:hypothetical protein SAMN05216252_102503 [Actinacidiphila glaucinigra]|uniref:Uncharacterized protein n=1 Tax=Actinacidiphila glaucinigra TaxID=235986 RepID=A0A239BBG9_9ACTN|nr:hypothetical protein SAMN05216252_102503 [Actinacidiphila glaucinigra]
MALEGHIITMRFRPDAGYWRVHAYGDGYVVPEDLRRPSSLCDYVDWPPPVPTWNLVSANTITRSRTITGMAHAG